MCCEPPARLSINTPPAHVAHVVPQPYEHHLASSAADSSVQERLASARVRGTMATQIHMHTAAC